MQVNAKKKTQVGTAPANRRVNLQINLSLKWDPGGGESLKKIKQKQKKKQDYNECYFSKDNNLIRMRTLTNHLTNKNIFS